LDDIADAPELLVGLATAAIGRISKPATNIADARSILNSSMLIFPE
jgi:hypothetical protein